MSFDFLEVRRDGAVERVTLNRPDVRNAINDRVIDELRRWADAAGARSTRSVSSSSAARGRRSRPAPTSSG